MKVPTIPKTIHGARRADERKFSDEKIRDIIENPSFKFYQAGGIEVYVKKSGRYYDVIIRNREGIIITEIGGADKSLRSIKDLQKIAKNYGWTTIPLN
ncbi:hypothetical protein FJZ31_19635 [Candidatus Poribacteria bacterium]|nr:hypothetical protein [Candidatus Poribacteria bacterium]